MLARGVHRRRRAAPHRRHALPARPRRRAHPAQHELGGFVAITDPGDIRGPRVELCERGVLLALEPFALPFLPASARVPLRVVIDAPRLPTNASRSRVRHDAAPIDSALARARTLVPAAIARLAELAPTDARARDARSRSSPVRSTARCGGWLDIPAPAARARRRPARARRARQPRAISDRWSDLVHTGRDPLPAELAPWLSDVLWIPHGDPAARLVASAIGLDPDAMRRRLRYARRQHRAREAFLAHDRRPATVVARERPRVRASLEAVLPETCIIPGVFAGMSGEICLHASGGSTLVVLHHGRELDRLTFDSEIAFEAVIDAPDVTPAERYRGIVRDAALARVTTAMRYGIVHAAEALALALAGRELPRGVEVRGAAAAADTDTHLEHRIDPRLVRTAVALVREMQLPLRTARDVAGVAETATGAWISLVDLTRVRAVGIVTQPGGRSAAAVARRARPRSPAARAGAAGSRARPLHQRANARGSVPARARPRPRARARVRGRRLLRGADRAGALVALLDLYHAGQLLETRPHVARFAPCAIALDDDAIVPSESWNFAVADDGAGKRNLARCEHALALAAALAVLGEPPAALAGDTRGGLDAPAGRALCAALAAGVVLDAPLVARLRDLPLVPRLGSDELASAAELAAVFPGAIPYLDTPELPVAGFSPMIAGEPVARAIGTLADRPVRDARPELARRRRIALWTERLAALRLLPSARSTSPASTST